MGDGTSGADRALPIARAPLAFGRIIIIGGGCYGSYYVRQLGRAAAVGAAKWKELIVVDRDRECLVAQLPMADRPSALRLETASWTDYFSRFLSDASDGRAPAGNDAIVPSPLMPHLMAEWLLMRAQVRWPRRQIAVAPMGTAPKVPWQMTGADNTQFVSFAEWICPVNCVEPVLCPATRGARSWSLPDALTSYVADERGAGRTVEGPFVFHCSHRTYGVGMIDVADVVAADRAIAERGMRGAASFLVGTASHCHGALQRIEVGPPVELGS
ncbi:MAG: hypothetical protein M3Z05_03765 [Gemmatimonadota bacterium]|nr:hypothetical protein [Gemmatimonadota bacterium]